MSVFGEIQLGMSRAVSDDEDDEFSVIEEDENLKRKVYWLSGDDAKISVDQLILADGPSSSAFLFTYLTSHFIDANNMKLIGLTGTMSEYKVFQVNHETPEEKIKAHPTFRSNFIYLINGLNGKNTIVCQLYDHLKANEINPWIKQLTTKIEFKSSLVFCSQNKTNYLGSNTEKVPFVKCLSSDKIYTDCARLEPPNFVSDLPAAVVHYCIGKNIEFLTFVCYNAYIAADMQSVKEIFKTASQRLKEKSVFIDNEITKKNLMSLNSVVASATALYM